MNNHSDTVCFLAGDSGGTKTSWRLLSPTQGVLSVFTLRGMASLHPGMLSVADIVAETAAKLPASVCPRLVYLSLGGPNTEEVQSALQKQFPCSEIRVEREADGTLLSEVSDLLHIHGAVLAGTGVVAIGFHGTSRRYAEGWGPVFGDFGSGGGIGMATVRAYLREIDGLASAGRVSELFESMTSDLDIARFADRMKFKERINALSRQDLAALVPKVMALALEGDETATRIIAEAAEEIGALAAAVLPQNGTVLWLGGLFKLGPDFRRQCEDALQRRRMGENCRGVYFESLSLGHIAAMRTLILGGVAPDSKLLKEVLYGN